MKKHFFLWAITFALVAVYALDAFAGTNMAGSGMEALLLASPPVAALPEAISAELKRISDELKSQAEAAQKEIKSHAKLSEETRAKVDELLAKHTELQANLQAAEQRLASIDSKAIGHERPKSMGEQVLEHENELAEFIAGGKGSFRVKVNAAITSDQASAGDLIVPDRIPGIVRPGRRRLHIRDLLRWGRTESNAVEFVRETGFTNNADVVSENPAAGKPESNITFEADQAKVATIAHFIHATRQILDDVPQLQAYIDGRLRDGLMLREDAQLLKGSGTGLNMKGIWTQASPYLNPGIVVQAETRIDRLRLAMLQVVLAEYAADGIVLNPLDWAAIELTKDSQNQYLMANPRALLVPTLWGLPVSETQAMDPGDFLVGAFQNGAQGWDRQDVEVMVSLEDRDNFIKNMVTIRCEERATVTVFRPESFVKGQFTDLPSSSGP